MYIVHRTGVRCRRERHGLLVLRIEVREQLRPLRTCVRQMCDQRFTDDGADVSLAHS